jgi:hypothetical protein
MTSEDEELKEIERIQDILDVVSVLPPSFTIEVDIGDMRLLLARATRPHD